nr:GNAT family N-acetyltransferase [Oscillospiraceae bacterium]
MKLRILADADEPVLTGLLTNDQIKQTYMLPDFPRREDALPLARRLMALSREESRFVRGMDEDGTLVGFLNDVEIHDDTIELGYVVHPEHCGQGYATAALQLAIAQLFQAGYRKVLCGAFEENTASIRVMEKAGMHRLETSGEIEYRGKFRRCVYFAMTL